MSDGKNTVEGMYIAKQHCFGCGGIRIPKVIAWCELPKFEEMEE